MGNAQNKSCWDGADSWLVSSLLPYLNLHDVSACSTMNRTLRTNMVLLTGKLTGLVRHLNNTPPRLYFVHPSRNRRRARESQQGIGPMYSCDTSSMVIILNVREFVDARPTILQLDERSYRCEYPDCAYMTDYEEDIVAHGKLFPGFHLLPGLRLPGQHLLPGLCRHSSITQISNAYRNREGERIPWHDKRRVEAHMRAITANTGYEVRANKAGYKDPTGDETLVWPKTRPTCSTPCKQLHAGQTVDRNSRAKKRRRGG